MKNTLGFFLLCASWLMPLHFLPWVSWHGEIIAFAAGLMLLLPLLNSKAISLPKSSVIFIVLFFISIAQVTMGYMNYRSDIFLILSYLALGFIVLLRGAYDGNCMHKNNTNHTKSLEILAWAIFFGAIVSSLLALTQVLEIFENTGFIARMPSTRRPGANLAQPNHLGSLLLLGLGSIMYLRERSQIQLPTFFLTSLLVCLGIASTESRTALLGLIIFFIWCLIGNQRKLINLSKKNLAFIILLSISFFIAWPHILIQLGILGEGATINTQKGLRPIVWSQLMLAIWEKPWFGWGIKQTSIAHNSVADIFAISEPFSYAHNIVIELAIGIGIPAAALLTIISIFWVINKIKLNQSLHEWYCVQILLVIGLHSLLEFPYAYAYFIIPAMYVTGMLDAIHKNTLCIPVHGKSASTIFAASLSILLWSIPQYLKNETGFRNARFEALRIGEPVSNQFETDSILFHQLNQLNWATTLNISPDINKNDIEILKKAALQFPWPATQSRYAFALALSGNDMEASRQLQVIRAMHGENIYQKIKVLWQSLETTKYPQLMKIQYLEKPTCIYWPCKGL